MSHEDFDPTIPGENPPEDATPEPPAEPGDETPIVVSSSNGVGPASAAPPRIVAETPIGGKPRFQPHLPVISPAGPEAAPAPEPVAEPPEPEAAPTPVEPADMEAGVVAEPEETKIEPVIEKAGLPPTAESPMRAEVQPPRPAPAQRPAAPPADAGPAATPEEWDEDISPELASILFGAKKARPEPAAPTVEKPSAEPAAPPAPAIHVTRIEQARTLPITALGISSPAPEPRPEGRAIHERVERLRVEEPSPPEAHGGKSITETWNYQDHPTLSGRQVKKIRVDEFAYADGSWRWTYERQYADRGKDRREVRTNTDHSYIERTDEIIRPDPISGKRVRYKEGEAMVLAGPEREKKHSLLSGLFGHEAEDEANARVWRPALPAEIRRLRRHGGDAF
jgi:hypothetical protein